MATITKRGEFQYQAKVRRKGFPTQSKTFERKQDALDWAATIESEIRRGVFLDRSELERTTLGDALTAYMTDIAQSLKSRVSVQSRVNAWLKHPLAKRPLATLKTADFLEWMRKRVAEVSPGTARRDLATVGATLKMVRNDWGQPIDKGLLTPVFKRLKVNEDGGRRLKPGDEELLLNMAREYSIDAAPCIILALDTGMRRAELCNLQWSQVDFRHNVIRLRNGATKNGSGRMVPLTTRAEEVLRSMPRSIDGRVFTTFTRPDSISQLFSRVRKRAGLSHIRFHDLRHEAASRLAPSMPTATLAKIMGWKSLNMAMRYYKANESDLVSVVREAEKLRMAA